MTEVVVRELYTYPIKGCAGGAVDRLALDETGIRGDREFAIIGKDGLLIEQKKTPIVACICAALSDGELRLSHSTQGDFRLVPSREGDSIPGTWVIDKFAGIDQGDEVAEWISSIVGRTARLICADEPWHINFPVPSMKRVHGRPKQKFTAATDVSLTNVASLQALNAELDLPIPMDRFRTNIVVDGIAAYEEDHMELVGNDDVELMQVTPAERCEIITTDQKTGDRPPNNVLKVLGKTRYKTKNRFGTGLLFGNYMRISKPGMLQVGDRLALRDMTDAERAAAEG